jgi:hypothetical protein
LRGEVREEAPGAAKTNISKQSFDALTYTTPTRLSTCCFTKLRWLSQRSSQCNIEELAISPFPTDACRPARRRSTSRKAVHFSGRMHALAPEIDRRPQADRRQIRALALNRLHRTESTHSTSAIFLGGTRAWPEARSYGFGIDGRDGILCLPFSAGLRRIDAHADVRKTLPNTFCGLCYSDRIAGTRDRSARVLPLRMSRLSVSTQPMIGFRLSF